MSEIKQLNVLFLCTGNSARSIMAESILRSLGAGIEDPAAVEGTDIEKERSAAAARERAGVNSQIDNLPLLPGGLAAVTGLPWRWPNGMDETVGCTAVLFSVGRGAFCEISEFCATLARVFLRARVPMRKNP